MCTIMGPLHMWHKNRQKLPIQITVYCLFFNQITQWLRNNPGRVLICLDLCGKAASTRSSEFDIF